MPRIEYPDKAAGDKYFAAEVNEVKDEVNALGTAADLDVGITDGTIPVLGPGGKLNLSVIPDGLTGGGGTGDVIGPINSADGRVVLFDGVSGKQLKQGAASQLVPTPAADGTVLWLASGAPAWVGVDDLAATLSAGSVPLAAVTDLDGAAAGALYSTAIIAASGAADGEFIANTGGALDGIATAPLNPAPGSASSSAGAITLTYSATVDKITTTTTQNIALTDASVAGLSVGEFGAWIVTFDAARQITFPSTWRVPSGSNPTFTGTSGAISWITFYRASSTVCHVQIGESLTAVA